MLIKRVNVPQKIFFQHDNQPFTQDENTIIQLLPNFLKKFQKDQANRGELSDQCYVQNTLNLQQQLFIFNRKSFTFKMIKFLFLQFIIFIPFLQQSKVRAEINNFSVEIFGISDIPLFRIIESLNYLLFFYTIFILYPKILKIFSITTNILMMRSPKMVEATINEQKNNISLSFYKFYKLLINLARIKKFEHLKVASLNQYILQQIDVIYDTIAENKNIINYYQFYQFICQCGIQITESDFVFLLKTISKQEITKNDIIKLVELLKQETQKDIYDYSKQLLIVFENQNLEGQIKLQTLGNLLQDYDMEDLTQKDKANIYQEVEFYANSLKKNEEDEDDEEELTISTSSFGMLIRNQVEEFAR